MTMPTPPAPAPQPEPADPGQQQPVQSTPPANPAPAPPPVPQPPTWTPPQPAQADDGGIDDLGKLPQKWQKVITDLRSESAKYRTSARTETVLRHAYTTATEHGVNPAALLGSTVFAAAAASLDPSAVDFPAKLAETIQAALTANPWMAAQQTTAPPPPPIPPQSGGDFTGSGGTGQQSLADQIREAETKGDWKTARQLKTQLMLTQ
ncbi:hypothetical protein [Streptosporangium sp. NPDC087985]|uniref:hypothetical protein n=1 Tax=Streptosporangium sp. NPDC087985 TaxID=3366196 RepID=UPI00380BFB0F